MRSTHLPLWSAGVRPAHRFTLLTHVLLAALAVWSLTRLALISCAWSQADFTPSTLLATLGLGLWQDLAACAWALGPLLVYLLLAPDRWWRCRIHRGALHLAVIALFSGLWFTALAEWLFWQEFNVRFNFIAVDYLIYRREVTDNILQSYPVVLLLTGVGALALGCWCCLRRRIAAVAVSSMPLRARLLPTLAWAAVATVVLLLPVQRGRAALPTTYQQELAGNGPLQFVRAFRNNELNYAQFYATLPDKLVTTELHHEVAPTGTMWDSSQPPSILRKIEATGPEKRLNVMLIMVESLSSDFLGTFGNTQGLTPNLDALVDQSLFFDNVYATGTRTTRGLEAVTLSIPPTPGRAIVKRLGRETGFWSLGNVLRSKGYDTEFIYGGRGYFENMNSFFAGNGYGIIDQSSTPEDAIHFTNAWGMADEDLYQQALLAADRANAAGKPFFFHLMTTSNHRPYTYPDHRIDIPSGSGREGAIKYTDWAIGAMLRQARQRPWFGNTLFVIVADHQAGSAGKVDLPLERYHIPLLVYAPAQISPARVSHLASQIDIAPTLLGLLNMSYESSFFGKNILSMAPSDERALIGNYQHLGLYRNHEMAILSPQKKIRLHLQADSSAIREVPAGTDDPLVQQAIAYYQGAAEIYARGLNHWHAEGGK